MPIPYRGAEQPQLSTTEKRRKLQTSAGQGSGDELVFTSNRRGDGDNVRYGSLDKYKVPRYRVAGYGGLLGLDRRFKLTSSTESKRYIEDISVDSTRRVRHASLLDASLAKSKDDIIVNSTSAVDSSFENQHDFIALSVHSGRKRRKLLRSDQTQAERHTNDGLSWASESSSESVAEESEAIAGKQMKMLEHEDAFEKFRNDPINRRNIELQKATESNRHDVDAWIALIEHQEQVFSLSMMVEGNRTSTAQKRGVSDLRISMYENALSHVTDPVGRERLIIGLMSEASLLWDTNKQLTQWRVILQRDNNIQLWYHFITFLESNPRLFSYDSVLAEHLQALERAKGLEDRESRDCRCVSIILRATTFMDKCGYTERALAVWQALLELNFCAPPKTQFDRSFADFETFWDSESPRIGEEGAKGWSLSSGEETEARTDYEPPAFSLDRLFGVWSAAEITSDRENCLPARTLDTTTEDDPFRVIIFSDIKDWLIEFSENSAKRLLLQGFLSFCGLPRLANSQFKQLVDCEDIALVRQLQVAAQVDDGAGPASNLYFSSIEPDTSTLFPGPTLIFNAWQPLHTAGSAITKLATLALSLLVEKLPQDSDLAECMVALRMHIDPNSARKYAKSLLKKRPNDLRLYNSFALVEARSGNSEASVRTWSAAISMLSGSQGNEDYKMILLWHTWIWEVLSDQKKEQALAMLIEGLPNAEAATSHNTAALGALTFTEEQVIRARHYINMCFTASLEARNSQLTSMCADLSAVLAYLLADGDLEVAAQSYVLTLSSLRTEPRAGVVELVHQYRARLVHLHAQSSPHGYRPAQLLPILKQSRTLFPKNSIFFSLYDLYSRKSGVIDRLRAVDIEDDSIPSRATGSIASIRNHQHSTTAHILKIASLLSQPLHSGVTQHSIRSAFSTATSELNAARQSTSIWLLWLKWELSLVQEAMISTSTPHQSTAVVMATTTMTTMPESKRLKSTLLLALNACPASKVLYLQAFLTATMRKVLGFRGMESIYRSMLERGLRVRFDIEDLIDELDETDADLKDTRLPV